MGCDSLLVCYRLSVLCAGKFLGSVMAIKISRENPWKDRICQSLHPTDICIAYLPSAFCPWFPPCIPESECTNPLTDFSTKTQLKNWLEHMFEIQIKERQIVLGESPIQFKESHAGVSFHHSKLHNTEKKKYRVLSFNLVEVILIWARLHAVYWKK